MGKYKSTYSGKTIQDNIIKFYDCLNTVLLHYTPGVRLIMQKDQKVLISNEDNGNWIFHPDEFGTWDIKAGNVGQESKISDIIIDSIAIRELNLLDD